MLTLSLPLAAWTPMSQNHSAIFQLLPELRNEVYKYYLVEETGYFHDGPTGKLRLANNDRIDLNLMYTCKAIYLEMHGLALNLNTVTFTPVEDHNAFGRKLELIQCDQCEVAMDVFKTLVSSASLMSEFLTPDIVDEVLRHYPRAPFLEPLREFVGIHDPKEQRPKYDYIYEVWEYKPNICLNLIQLAARKPGFIPLVRPCTPGLVTNIHWTWSYQFPLQISDLDQFSKFIGFRLPKWHIPTGSDVAEMNTFHLSPHILGGVAISNGWAYRERFYFSAAAAAINFLQSISAGLRRSARRIIINENRQATNEPKDHIKGLIPFLLENPELRMERRVDLWRALYMGELLDFASDMAYPNQPLRMADFQTGCETDWAYYKIGYWIEVAMSLEASIPRGSFSLSFHGATASDSQTSGI